MAVITRGMMISGLAQLGTEDISFDKTESPELVRQAQDVALANNLHDDANHTGAKALAHYAMARADGNPEKAKEIMANIANLPASLKVEGPDNTQVTLSDWGMIAEKQLDRQRTEPEVAAADNAAGTLDIGAGNIKGTATAAAMAFNNAVSGIPGPQQTPVAPSLAGSAPSRLTLG